MKVYKAEVTDKVFGEEQTLGNGGKFYAYVAEANDLEEYDTNIERYGITDDDVHFCFLPTDERTGENTYETEEFKYVLLEELSVKENE